MFGTRNKQRRRPMVIERLNPRCMLTFDLLVSEINYDPFPPTEAEIMAAEMLNPPLVLDVDSDFEYTGDDFEFIEFYNDEDFQLFASSYDMIDGVGFTFPAATVIQPGEFGVIVRNQAAFELRYGTDVKIYGEYTGGLKDGGEDLEMVLNGDKGPERIFRFGYETVRPWPARAEGDGSTLELIRPGGTKKSDLGEFFSWRPSTDFGGSPGRPGTPPVGVTINEVLAHTDAPITPPDSIEVSNQTNRSIDIGGWFISDNRTRPFKFEIPAGTVLGPGESTFYGEPDFNPDPSNPGPNDFALSSAKGDEVILVIPGNDGEIGLYVDDVRFGATPNNESLGFLPGGLGGLARLETVSLGCTNYVPRVGPVIISEVHYNPLVATSAARTIDPTIVVDDLEFIEFHNTGTEDIVLEEWRMRGAAKFNFLPEDMLAAGETFILVAWDPNDPLLSDKEEAFRVNYGIGNDVRIMGPFDGELNNAGEQIRLTFPDEPPMTEPDLIPRMLHDFMTYVDEKPFPNDADGDGDSLQRRSSIAYGDFATSWVAEPPTPGTPTYVGPDGGDLTGNGVTEPGDVEIIREAIKDGRFSTFFDIDGNASLNEQDIAELVQNVVGTHLGDANLDGVVDAVDFNRIQRGMTTSCKTWGEGDFNGDNLVDSFDLDFWQDHKFQGSRGRPASYDPDRLPMAPAVTQPAAADTLRVQPVVADVLFATAKATNQNATQESVAEPSQDESNVMADSPRRSKHRIENQTRRNSTTRDQLHDSILVTPDSLQDWQGI